jgi:hypothetical protein
LPDTRWGALARQLLEESCIWLRTERTNTDAAGLPGIESGLPWTAFRVVEISVSLSTTIKSSFLHLLYRGQDALCRENSCASQLIHNSSLPHRTETQTAAYSFHHGGMIKAPGWRIVMRSEARPMSKPGTFLLRLSATLLGVCASGSMAQQPANPNLPAAQLSDEQLKVVADRLAWHRKMAALPKPKAGCFAAAYPAEEWTQTQCSSPPQMPHTRPPNITNWLRSHPGVGAPSQPAGLAVAGSGNDVVAVAVGGPITGVEGSFPQTMDIQYVTSVKSPTQASPDAYALQINVAPFSSPAACAHAQNPQTCQGWLQYLFMNDDKGSLALMEVWLFNFGPTCPGQGSVPQLPGMPPGISWSQSSGDCVFDSPTTPLLAAQPVTSLGQLIMRGEAVPGGQDSVTITLSNGSISGVSISDEILNLSAVWQQVEFNIFGYINGERAQFNPGAAAVVHLDVQNATANAPGLLNSGFTGETNTFNLVLPGCSTAGIPPSIGFEEITVLGQRSLACPPVILVPPPPPQPTPCQSATEGVTADQAILAKAQAALTGAACYGPARFDCERTIQTDQSLLNAAIIQKNKVCKT